MNTILEIDCPKKSGGLKRASVSGWATRSPLNEWESRLGDCRDWALPCDGDEGWTAVEVPHNWEDYHGYHAVSHGNLHGTAWYRAGVDWQSGDGRVYAFFEGVGSYASVFCNGTLVGEHAGGRTTFTVDLTPALREGKNLLAVRAHHPEKIDDLPFVCGGCWGAPNTEGSQPFGIFRPVWLERTGPVRVAPFGVHVLTPKVAREAAEIRITTEVRNGGRESSNGILRTVIFDPEGGAVFSQEIPVELSGGECQRVSQDFPRLESPHLWEPGSPALYRAVSSIEVGGSLSHATETTFGLRSLEWPEIRQPDADWNVVSPDRRGRMVSNGSVERTPENNGLTRLLHQSDFPVRVAPMGAVVKLSGGDLPGCASLVAELALACARPCDIRLVCEIQNEGGTIFFHQQRDELALSEGVTKRAWQVPAIHRPRLWNSDEPYLHKLIVELRGADGVLWERSETLFGIRETTGPLNLDRAQFEKESETAEPDNRPPESKVLRINGAPIFLNGTCEYETLLGCDHAFTDEQIAANVAMMRAAGFNAFREGHHPHNLRYYDHWDQAGIVCWTQMGSNIWFDTPEFRANFKRLVREWVRERRNHPCVILWGLQNESALPEDFAREVRDLIRELDPTSPAWRPTTTCNGGKGSDWNVPQEWSGTYGGNFHDYDLERLQMVGEYGAWRAFGVHTECEYRGDENDASESWACQAMETKIRLGELARDRAIGHFHWVFNTFPNPGRTADNFEGPGNGEIGSVNNKGLVTAWGQPSDLYYLYRANYADPASSPMVYIVSHTWSDRWKVPGPGTVRVFSNCEEVELLDGSRSLGCHSQPGRGRHFQWKNVELESGALHAVGRCDGKDVARDLIVLNHFREDNSLNSWLAEPPASNSAKLSMEGWPPCRPIFSSKVDIMGADSAAPSSSKCGEQQLEIPNNPAPFPPDPGPCLFRVSCGDNERFLDAQGRIWQADQEFHPGESWGWTSWGNDYENIPNDLASCGYTMTPVCGTAVPQLYRCYRFGRHRLKYHFHLDHRSIMLRLHFTEPWFGVGGGMDCRGMRIFDIAANGTPIDHDVDIWVATGGDHRALVREYPLDVEGGLHIGFPRVLANQALICGVEIFARSAA